MQALRNIRVQLGGRSLDVPTSSLHQLPSLSELRHHAKSVFRLPSEQAPVFLHDGTKISGESSWKRLLSQPPASLSLHLKLEPSASFPAQRADDGPAPLLPAPRVRVDYFAVEGKNGNVTLYLNKAEFDQRVQAFAQESSLGPGMRAIFPPAYKDEYTELFRERGVDIEVTTQATALVQRWHKRLAAGGGVVAGGLAGLATENALGAGLIAVGSAGVAETTLGVVGVEAGAAAVGTEAAVGSGAAVAGMGASVAACAVATALVGYLTYRGLKVLLPELHKEQYTILMNVAEEDPGMLEMGRQLPLCGVCKERPQGAVAMPCGHRACYPCFASTCRRRRGLACPLCKLVVEKIQRYDM